MKKKLVLILIFLLIFTIKSQSQIIIGGNTYGPPVPGTGTMGDLGTFTFSYDSFIGAGGLNTVFRKDNYWYRVSNGFGLSVGIYYLNARTVIQHLTPNPPDCAQWQGYSVPSPGAQWVGFPTSTPMVPNGVIFNLNISGPSVSFLPSSSTVINPDYIDLSNKNPTEISTILPQSGRILYNNCAEAIIFNTGATWKSVWPNYENYQLNKNQSLNFGDNDTKILGNVNNSGFGDIQLFFRTTGTDKIILGKAGFSEFNNINIKSSIGTPVNTINTNYVLGDNDHTIIHTGTIPNTLTLPSPSDTKNRQYIIANHSISPITFSAFSIIGLGTTLGVGQNVIIVSNGSNWYKVN